MTTPHSMNISTPLCNDILLGRGKSSTHNKSNARYRAMVQEYKKDYQMYTRLQKTQLAKRLVEEWQHQDPPGRFLKRDENTGLWHCIPDERARCKTSQLLREGAPKIRQQLKAESVMRKQQQSQVEALANRENEQSQQPPASKPNDTQAPVIIAKPPSMTTLQILKIPMPAYKKANGMVDKGKNANDESMSEEATCFPNNNNNNNNNPKELAVDDAVELSNSAHSIAKAMSEQKDDQSRMTIGPAQATEIVELPMAKKKTAADIKKRSNSSFAAWKTAKYEGKKNAPSSRPRRDIWVRRKSPTAVPPTIQAGRAVTPTSPSKEAPEDPIMHTNAVQADPHPQSVAHKALLETMSAIPFPQRLWQLFIPKYAKTIWWIRLSERGDYAFAIKASRFKGKNTFSYILRYLDLWGFRKCGHLSQPDALFYHPLFQKGKPELVKMIKKKEGGKIELSTNSNGNATSCQRRIVEVFRPGTFITTSNCLVPATGSISPFTYYRYPQYIQLGSKVSAQGRQYRDGVPRSRKPDPEGFKIEKAEGSHGPFKPAFY